MSLGKPVGWECVDTSSDIESCGGCEWPVAGGKQGEDCAALEGVSQVAVSLDGIWCNGMMLISSVISATVEHARR
jgi:hypothetical protein